MVLVVGDINLDISGRLAAHPAVGEDCLSQELSFQCGGVGLNAAIAFTRLNTSARLVSCVGKDWFADFMLERLRAEGVDTAHIQRSEQTMTGLMFVAISPDGQRTFFGSRGANAELRSDRRLLSSLGGISAVQVAGFTFLAAGSAEFADEVIAAAKARGIWVTLDIGAGPSREVPEKLMRVVGEVDTVFANHTEALALTGQTGMEHAFTALERAGAREVVMKLGGDGCLIRDAGQLCRVPSFPVRVVDTTGAGDAFTAAFITARLWGWTPRECAVLANASGAAATRVLGAGERLPALAVVEELLESAELEDRWDEVRREVSRRLRVGAGAVAGREGA
jgi:ribokinase